MQELLNENLETQKQGFQLEKKELIDKIESLQAKISEKERELTHIQHNQDNISSKAKSKEQELTEIKQEFLVEKTKLNEKIDELRDKLGFTNDDLVKAQLGNERETALTNQKIEFQEKKIQELLKALSDSNQSYQEKLSCQKNEFGAEATSMIT